MHGYSILDVEPTEKRDDGTELWMVTDWEPYEISIVSVPADISVGIGRMAVMPAANAPEVPAIANADTASATAERAVIDTPGTQHHMIKILRDKSGHLVRAKVNEEGEIVETLETLERASEAEQSSVQRGREAERTRTRAITEMADKVGKNIDNIDELVRKAIAGNTTPDQFQGVLLDALSLHGARREPPSEWPRRP